MSVESALVEEPRESVASGDHRLGLGGASLAPLAMAQRGGLDPDPAAPGASARPESEGLTEAASVSGLLAQRHVLLVEDDFLLARQLKRALEARGAVVLGPVAQDREAARLIKGATRLDYAVLDLDLDGRSAAPIAMALRERGVRMVVVTGCDVTALPAPLHDVPVCQKPATIEQIEAALSRIG